MNNILLWVAATSAAGGIVTGTATGSIEFTGTADAKRVRTATTTASLEFTATASAKRLRTAIASGSIEFIATAISTNYQIATAAGGIEFTGTSTAKRVRTGTSAGSIEFVAASAGKVLRTATAVGAIEFTGTAIGTIIGGFVLGDAAGTIEFTATADAHNYQLATATGAIEFTATASGTILEFAVVWKDSFVVWLDTFVVWEDMLVAAEETSTATGSFEFTATANARIFCFATASGSIEFTSEVSAGVGIALMPPELHESIIDPYAGGAWLWMVKVTIPGYSPLWYVRNTEDKTYGGKLYTKNNFKIGLATLSGDGSVPRSALVIAQDADYTLEDRINATQGAGGGTVKIIRAHEDFLDKFIIELEQYVGILTANSDANNITFKLGIPNPLQRKIPLRRYSSKTCPYALPSLFKGLECQYTGGDTTCTGKFEDCFDKNNTEHWGGEIGLDPAVAR